MPKDNIASAGVAINEIMVEIGMERIAQDEKWGQQDHPSFVDEASVRNAQRAADHWKQRNDARVEDGTLAWDGILLEEVYEALAETEPTLRRAELVQVAAVAAAEIEAIDRMLASFEQAEVVEVDYTDGEDAA